MASLREFLSPAAGQKRRAWLDETLDQYVAKPLNYYLGPTGVPGKMQNLGEALEFTDAGDMPAAAEASRNLWNNPTLGNAAEMTAAGIALGLPMYSQRMGEGIADLADELVRGYDPNTMNANIGPQSKTGRGVDMSNIFKKAREVADALKAQGHHVDLTTHPTRYGNSAYLTASKSADGGFIKRGFRLSDHDTGERRKLTDDFATIIDSDDITVADLISEARISDSDLSEHVASLLTRRKEAAAAQDALENEALRFWDTLAPEDKASLAPKQHAGKDKKGRALYALRRFNQLNR